MAEVLTHILDSRYLYAVTGASPVFYEHSETNSNRLTPVVGEKSRFHSQTQLNERNRLFTTTINKQ